MSREYLESMIPEIEEFCELGEYLSLPVRTYSAGMMTRLGFALVTALDPDVLLMDEGFGAADLRFAERSAERMDAFIGRSRIMVLASHSDSMIASICNKAAWLSEGKLLEVGPLDEVLEKYHESVRSKTTAKSDSVKSESAPASEVLDGEDTCVLEVLPPTYCEELIRDVGVNDRRSRATGRAIFTKLVASDSEGGRRWDYEQGQVVNFRIEYETVLAVPEISVLLRLYLDVPDGNGVSPQVVADVTKVISEGRVAAGHKGWIEVSVPTQHLMPIAYSIYVWIGYQNYKVCYDVIDTNVAIPKLVIVPRASDYPSAGKLALSCSWRSGVVASSESTAASTET